MDSWNSLQRFFKITCVRVVRVMAWPGFLRGYSLCIWYLCSFRHMSFISLAIGNRMYFAWSAQGIPRWWVSNLWISLILQRFFVYFRAFRAHRSNIYGPREIQTNSCRSHAQALIQCMVRSYISQISCISHSFFGHLDFDGLPVVLFHALELLAPNLRARRLAWKHQDVKILKLYVFLPQISFISSQLQIETDDDGTKVSFSCSCRRLWRNDNMWRSNVEHCVCGKSIETARANIVFSRKHFLVHCGEW